MDFTDTLLFMLEQEIQLPKASTPQDKVALQSKIALKNELLKKKNKKLTLDPLTGKAKLDSLSAIDKKIDPALAKIKI